MDNNDQNKIPSGLTEENLKWLEEMMESTSPAPDPAPEAEPEIVDEAEPEQTAQKSAEDQELDDILATDWDHITLPADPAEKDESTIRFFVSAESVSDLPTSEDNIIDDDILKLLGDEQNTQDTDAVIPQQKSDDVIDELKGSHDDLEEPENPKEKADVSVKDTPEVKSEQPKSPKEKGRPKKKDAYGMFGIPHVLSTAIWVVLILAIGMSLGRVLWVCCADLMAFGKEDRKITITITAEDNIDSISKKLGQAKLIKYPNLFKFFATVTGKDDDICVGTYTLSPILDYNAMINAMYQEDSGKEVVEIMFPDGVTCAQIFQTLADNGVCTLEELESYALKGDLNDYWFLEGVPRGDDKYWLEGYLAPDTYAFYKGDSPRRVLEKFLTEFDERFTDKMRDNFEILKEDYASLLRKNNNSEKDIAENELTLHQVVTLASLVQKQFPSEEEGYKIAAVFYGRLADPAFGFLGTDENDKGIPSKPVCNIGSQALYSVLEPDPNSYQYKYFVYDPNKKLHSFFTKEEKDEYEKVLDQIQQEQGN